MKIDLYTDWIVFLRANLEAMGYSVDPKAKDLDVAVKYFNVLKRTVPVRPRAVLQSREFKCPPRHQTAVDTIRDAATKGTDLTPRLSRSLLDADYNDGLLNHWGIHHFHLGSATDTDGFISRTDDLLFARVTDDQMFLIGVMPHGSWSDQRLVEIIHANWPESIEGFRLRGIPAQTLSDQEIAKCRKVGVDPGISVGGNIYIAFGGGYASTGVNGEAILRHDATAMQFRRLEAQIKASESQLIAAAVAQGFSVVAPLNLSLVFGAGGEFLVKDKASQVVFKVAA